MQKIYLPQRIFTGEEWLSDKALILQDGIIEDIISASDVASSDDIIHLENCFVAPAYIDLQIYGANKKLLAVHPTVDALQDLYEYCKNGGAALFQPTAATNDLDVFHRCIDAVRAYWQSGGKGCIGLHLEGPWISVEKRGAHPKEFIHSPSFQEVKDLLEYGKGVITMITLAPEVCSDEVVQYIQANNIIVSAGHSNASYQQAMSALDNGIPTITHLYNAMSPLQHREPGLVGAAFTHTLAKASIIPDGYHVDFAAVAIAKEMMKERLFVITDAVTETTEGVYPHQLEGEKYVSNGILSGSALTMHKAVLNLVNKVHIPVEEAIRMCSLYPAQLMKLDHLYGKIAPGYTAQFVVLDQEYRLQDVITL
jgi:N-acetylglucosamine-6-phosphate deacetylase